MKQIYLRAQSNMKRKILMLNRNSALCVSENNKKEQADHQTWNFLSIQLQIHLQ